MLKGGATVGAVHSVPHTRSAGSGWKSRWTNGWGQISGVLGSQ